MSEIKFTDKEKLRLNELAAMDNIFPRALIKGGLMDWCNKVCGFYHIDIHQFRSSKRDRLFIKARRDFIHLVIINTDYNMNDIARFMKRDHTSVIHHLGKQPFNITKFPLKDISE